MTSTILSTLREFDYRDEKKLRSYFDDIMSRMPVDDDQYLSEVVNALIDVKFMCTDTIDHPLFVSMRNIFIETIKKSANDYELSRRIGQLFTQIMKNVTDENIHLVRQLFAEQNLADCSVKSLQNLLPTSNNKLIGSIEYMIDAYQTFQEDRPTVQNDPILLILIMPIFEFIKSAEYRNSFMQLSINHDELTRYQKLILVTCPKYIVSHWGQHHEEITSRTAQYMLNQTTEIFKHFLPSIDDWKEPIIWCTFWLILLCQNCANERLLSVYSAEHEKILECVLEIIQGKELWQLACQNSTSSEKRQKRAGQLFCYATLYIYTMSFLPELRDKLEENNTVPLLMKLTEVNFDKTQLHAYRALAVILTDNDIKQLANPARVTNVFVFYLKKSIDGIGLNQRLENSRLSLKILMQHEQIKDEFVKHTDGIPLLLRCATETRFDGTKIQLSALKILMSLTFNSEGKSLLLKNDNFIQYLKTLVASSKPPDLQKVANGILWRLFPKYEKHESNFKYDAMISYAHKDKEVCHRIYKTLAADNFRIWIDLEQMHGTIMQVMAEAVEQSNYVIVCMSDNYIVSPYCQAEAQYAFEQRRILIPLRVQAGYKPQGWLGFLLSGRMYIDFMKTNFNTAYAQLLSEFRLNQLDKKQNTTFVNHSNVSESPAVIDERITYSYSNDVLQRTPADVHNFLLDKQLNQMVPVCQQMDERKLTELYRLCHVNSPVLLQTLRSETKELHSTTLSTNIYLTFIHEMKNLIPEEISNKAVQQSVACTLL
ncbi:unnamed protein product [Rotaria socialis]